jgi:serine/threonine protein kinase
MTDWKQLELFEREARVLESLDHPGIPKYLDYLTEDTEKDRGFFLVQVCACVSLSSCKRKVLSLCYIHLNVTPKLSNSAFHRSWRRGRAWRS